MEEHTNLDPLPEKETDTSSELNRDRVESGAQEKYSEMPEGPSGTGNELLVRQTDPERGQTETDGIQDKPSETEPARGQRPESTAAVRDVSGGALPENDRSAAGGAAGSGRLSADAGIQGNDRQAAGTGDQAGDDQSADTGNQGEDRQAAGTGNQVRDDQSADAGKQDSGRQAAGTGDQVRDKQSADAGNLGHDRQDADARDRRGDKKSTGPVVIGADSASGTKKEAPARKVPSYEEKLLRHKKRIYRRTIILVTIVIAAVMTAVILWMRRGYTRAELTRITAFTVEDGTEYENLNGNLVRYSSSGAICTDRRGNTRWSVSYEMQEPITSVSGDVIAIANRSGYNVYVMNSEGLIGTIETMLPIHIIAAAENGEVAFIINDSKSAWIRLYTGEGKEIAYIVQTMAENGYPVAAAVSPDGKMLSLSSVQLSNSAVKSNVSFYNFGKQGRKAVDHRVDYSDFIDEVVPYIRYMGDSVCAGISDKRLILFRKTLLQKSGSTSILFSESLQGVFSNESFIGLLFNDTREETQYRLDLYNRRGKKSGSIHFTMQYKDIQIAGDKVYINNAEQCQIYTLSGRCLFDGEFGRPVSALIPGSGLGDLLVVTGGEIDSVRLH